MLTVRLLIYLIMSMAYMISAILACDIIKRHPESNMPWLIAAPSLVLTLTLLIVMVDDLLS